MIAILCIFYLQNTTGELANILTTSVVQLPDRIEKLLTENKTYKNKYTILLDHYADMIKNDLLKQSNGPLVSHMFTDLTMKELEMIAAKLRQHTDKIILFGTQAEQKLLLTHNSEVTLHCGKTIHLYLDQFHGKGGGNNKKAQAVFQSKRDLQKYFQTLKDHLQNNIPVN